MKSLLSSATWILLGGVLGVGATGAAEPLPKPAPETFERRIITATAEPGAEPKVMVWHGADGSVIEFGRGFLGIQLVELTPELRKHFGVDEKNGVLISRVEKDSPAEKAGLAVGDIVLSVDGEDVSWSGEVGARVRKKKQGETASLEVVRNGRGQTFQVEVAERDPERRLLRKFDMEGHPGIEIERFGPAMERAFAVIDDPEVRDRIRERMEFRSAHTEELEKRLKDLEGRLKELEKLLDEKNRR